MKSRYSFREIKDRAKTNLVGRYIGAIGILLFYEFFVSIVDRFIGVSLLSTIFTNYFSPFLIGGVYFFFLKTACGNRGYLSDLMIGFMENTSGMAILALIHGSLNMLSLLPSQLLFQFWRNGGELTEELLLIGLIIQLAALLACFVGEILFSQSYFVLLDFPDYSPMQVLRLSIHLIRGNFLRTALLELSFIPLFLLIIPTLGLALLWILPYYYATKAHYYLELVQDKSIEETN